MHLTIPALSTDFIYNFSNVLQKFSTESIILGGELNCLFSI